MAKVAMQRAISDFESLVYDHAQFLGLEQEESPTNSIIDQIYRSQDTIRSDICVDGYEELEFVRLRFDLFTSLKMMIEQMGKTNGTPGKPKRKRGRKRMPEEEDNGLVADWDRARGAGILKQTFADDKRIKVEDLDKVLARVRMRSNRQS